MKKDATEIVDLRLEPIEVAQIEPDVAIPLNNIFFDYNKSILKAESFPELNRIAEIMKKKSTMTVEIAGHADATGADDYNMKLSEQRATSVARYLYSKGVETFRVSPVFFGETKPIDTNDTPAGRKKNRRVEFKVIKP